MGWMLHGLLAEESPSQRPHFYVWIVRMPLFVPTDVINLSWSERFGGSSQVFEPGTAATQEALAQAARRALKEADADGLVIDPPVGTENVKMQEGRGYGLLLEGNLGGALEVLARVIRYEARYPWEEAFVKRARTSSQVSLHTHLSFTKFVRQP